MKIDTSYSVDTSFTEKQNFRIDASAKAFQILSGNIYKDVLLAIVRELSANAWDAHVSKGNTDVPFEIAVPTALKPELVIRDYGIGLSPEAMMSLFTVYFGSDKTWTDELIGGLGLGAKTPFAYTDAFTVVSRWKGQIHTFACFLDDKKMPAMTQVATAQNPDPDDTGLTITIPCKETEEVKKKLSVLQWYPTTPRILGGAIETENSKRIFEDSTVTLTEASRPMYTWQHNSGKVYVVMGHVPYLIGDAPRGRFSFDYYFHVPIGTYEPSASRESLSDVTVASFAAKVDEANRKYVAKIGEIMEDPKLTTLEILALANDNWKVLEKHSKVQGIWQRFGQIFETHKPTLRDYKHDYSGEKVVSRKGHYTSRNMFEDIRKCPTKVNIVVLPAGERVMHCKMVHHHFEDTVEYTYTLECNKGVKDELDKLFGPGICSHAADWPVPKATTKQRTTKKYSSDAYRGIYVCTGSDIEEVDYREAIQYSTEEYFYATWSRRSYTNPNYHYNIRELKTLAKMLPYKGLLFVPDTELLKGRFSKAGFLYVKAAIEKAWPEIPHLHFSFDNIEGLVEQKYCRELSLLANVSGKKHSRILTIGKAKMLDLRKVSRFTTAVRKYGPGDLVPKEVDQDYLKSTIRFLARFRYRYPQFDTCKNINDYMRYENYARSHNIP